MPAEDDGEGVCLKLDDGSAPPAARDARESRTAAGWMPAAGSQGAVMTSWPDASAKTSGLAARLARLSPAWRMGLLLCVLVPLPQSVLLWFSELGLVGEHARAMALLLALSMALIVPVSRLTVSLLVLNDLAEINRFCDEIKRGRYSTRFDIGLEKGDEHEIIRLKRNMNWMAHQIESQSRAMRDRLDQAGARQQQYQELSNRDPLTSLFNRRYMEEALRALDRFGSDGTFLALLDCDSFKRVNDAKGHRVGDEILVALGRIVTESVREREDVAFRFGGDEFGVLFRGMDLPGCLLACERIRARFEAGNGHGCTVSVGVAPFCPGQSSEDMFAASDRALYRAKTEGRNRVVHAAGVQAGGPAGTGRRWGCSGTTWS